MNRKDTKVIEVTNGWAKIALEKLKEANSQLLDIRAGSPMRPSILDEVDVRSNRKGFFSGLSKAFGSKVLSQLSITVRPFPKLMTAKQVDSLIGYRCMLICCQAIV